MESIAEGLANIGNDANSSHQAIIDQEQREWDNMFEIFQDESILIKEEIIEREEREIQERLQRETAEKNRVDGAAILIQSTFRGWYAREEILRELTERARSQLEFDLDANMFRQHMLMTTIDSNRVKMESDYLAACRTKAIADDVCTHPIIETKHKNSFRHLNTTNTKHSVMPTGENKKQRDRLKFALLKPESMSSLLFLLFRLEKNYYFRNTKRVTPLL